METHPRNQLKCAFALTRVHGDTPSRHIADGCDTDLADHRRIVLVTGRTVWELVLNSLAFRGILVEELHKVRVSLIGTRSAVENDFLHLRSADGDLHRSLLARWLLREEGQYHL